MLVVGGGNDELIVGFEPFNTNMFPMPIAVANGFIGSVCGGGVPTDNVGNDERLDVWWIGGRPIPLTLFMPAPTPYPYPDTTELNPAPVLSIVNGKLGPGDTDAEDSYVFTFRVV